MVVRAIDPTAIATTVLGLAIALFWFFDWQLTAISLFLIGAIQRSITIVVLTAKIIRGHTRDPHLQEAAAAYVQSTEPRRFLAHFGLARFSEATAWPANTLLTAGLGAVIGFVTPDRIEMSRERAMHYVSFYCPPALISLATHGFQAWFLTTQFSVPTQASWIFSIAVALQMAGFVALGLHFFARRKFMKNFSGSGMSPFLFVAATAVLSVTASAALGILAGTTFGGHAPTIDWEAMYKFIRALAVQEGLFDLINLLRDSETSTEFVSAVLASFAQITWLGSFEAFLSAFVVFAPIRALWTSLTFKRDDEDRRSRAQYFLSGGRTDAARAEAERMESVAEAASVKALSALCDGNYDLFVHEVQLVDGSAKLAAAGRDPDVLRHIHMLQAMAVAPVDAELFADLLEALWLERGRLASIFFLSSCLAERHGGQAALKKQTRGRTWGEAVNGTFAFIDERLGSGDDLASSIQAQYPGAPMALELALAIGFQVKSSLLKDPQKRIAAKNQIDIMLEAIAHRIQAADDDNLAYAMLGQLYGAPMHYQATFDSEPKGWSSVIELLERKMVNSGLALTEAYGGTRSAQFRY